MMAALVFSVAVAATPAHTLQRWAAGGLTWELGVGPCGEKADGVQCPLEVRVRRGNKLVTKATASEMGVTAGTLTHEASGEGWRLQTDSEYDEQVITAVAEPLAPNVYGLLVHTVAGFEHLHDTHVLFSLRGETLTREWVRTSSIPRESTWAEVWLRDLDHDGYAELVTALVEYYRLAQDVGPETWSAQVQTYDPVRNALGPARSPAVFAAIAASFRTRQEAMRYRSAHKCLSRFLILESAQHAKLKPGWLVVARMELDRARAMQHAESVQRCGLTAYMKRAQ